MAVGAVENKFYAELIDGLGLDPALVATQNDQSQWPELQTVFEAVFATRTRAEWEAVFAHARRVRHAGAQHGGGDGVPAQRRAATASSTANGYVQVAPPVRFGRTPGVDRWSGTAAGRRQRSDPGRARVHADEIEKLRAAAVTE